jgi:hypothetical protein
MSTGTSLLRPQLPRQQASCASWQAANTVLCQEQSTGMPKAPQRPAALLLTSCYCAGIVSWSVHVLLRLAATYPLVVLSTGVCRKQLQLCATQCIA